MTRAQKIPIWASVDSSRSNRHMKYTKTSSGRMAGSAKMVLAASRSFTERSPTFDPPRQARRQTLSLASSVPGAAADPKEKRPGNAAPKPAAVLMPAELDRGLTARSADQTQG